MVEKYSKKKTDDNFMTLGNDCRTTLNDFNQSAGFYKHFCHKD